MAGCAEDAQKGSPYGLVGAHMGPPESTFTSSWMSYTFKEASTAKEWTTIGEYKYSAEGLRDPPIDI